MLGGSRSQWSSSLTVCDSADPSREGLHTVHWDRESSLARVGNDLELLCEIAQLFVDDAANMLSAIEQAVAAGDAAALGRSAHTLKGCVSNFSAPETFDAALELEKLGRSGDLSTVQESLTRLRRSLDDLCPELRALSAE